MKVQMMKNNPHPIHIWHIFLLFLVFCLINSSGAAAASNPAPEIWLISYRGQDSQALQTLADLSLPVYARFYSASGDTRILLPASSEQVQRLTQAGFTAQSLGTHTLADGQAYYLVYGLESDLDQAIQFAEILWKEGRLAILRATVEQTDQVAQHGIQTQLLRLRSLVIPNDQLTSVESAAAPEAITPSSQVLSMINQVSSTDLYTTVGNLSGKWPVVINDSPYTLLTRYTYAYTPITKATRLAYETFLGLGLTTWYDYYFIGSGEYRNVLAQQTGLTQPERVFLLSAHLDSYSPTPYTLAPGADDNASGSAALLAIARILRQYQFGCTLRYALFTGEEVGYYGSEAYAAYPDPALGTLQSVLNLDMLGYNSTGTAPTIELHTRYANTGDLAIAYLFRDVINAYQIYLTPAILQDGLSFSDHASFWAEGYPAILAIEDWDDHTPYYHTVNDKVDTLDMAYFTQFTKAALATFAHMGCLLEGQVSGMVQNATTGAPIAGASVQASQDAQNTWATTSLADGTYKLVLLPGTYTVQATAVNYLSKQVDNVVVSTSQPVTLNFSLQPCTWVQWTGLTISDTTPLVGETVFFSAAASGATPITYAWDFGDGSSASGPAVSHAYAKKGVYKVRVAAANLCSSTVAERIIAVETIPVYLPLVKNSQ